MTLEEYLLLEDPGVYLVIGSRELDFIAGSLRIKKTINRRSSIRMSIESDVDLNFEEGESISLWLRGEKAFEGVLMQPTEVWPGPSNRVYTIEGSDWHYLVDRRVIAAAFQSASIEDIVTAIVTDHLANDDVAVGTITAPQLVQEAIFSYVHASTALNRLAEISNCYWYVDDDKALHFVPRNTLTAPFSIDAVTEYAENLKHSVGNRDYRNRQYIKGGKAETLPRDESWIGDDTSQSFTTAFPISAEPTILLNYIPQTVDVLGIGDPDSQWFWTYGSNIISQNSSDTPISSSDVLSITYVGLFDLVVVSQDVSETERRLAAEGFGTGLVDNVAIDFGVKTVSDAFDLAAGKLAVYSVQGESLEWTTEESGLIPGQLIDVNLVDQGIVNQLLITEIDVRDVSSRLVYTVRAVDGPDDADWIGFFARMFTPTDPLFIREGISEEEVFILLSTHSENWQWSEDFDVFAYVCLTPSDTWYLSESTETYDQVALGYDSAITYYDGDGVEDLEVVC